MIEWQVSIHAPARGATYFSDFWKEYPRFQSTRPRGARLAIQAVYTMPNRFQSTRPRGARHRGIPGRRRHQGFNPRARAGRDLVFVLLPQTYRVSIHAPARGATNIEREREAWIKFQSTRPRGARQDIHFIIRLPKVSIHAPARGATVIFEPRKNHAVSDMISRTHLFKYCGPPSNVSISVQNSHFSSGANSPEKTCTLPVRTYTISIPSGS